MEIDFSDSAIRLFSGVSLVVFLLLSFRVVREDLATQKIPNSLIIRFLKISAVMFVALAAYGFIRSNPFAVNYAKVALINTAVALFIGYVLWYFDLFSPGDAKYFAMAAFLIPLEVYTFQFVPMFPSLIVLVNAYVIAFLSMFAYVLLRLAAKGFAAVSEGKESRGEIKKSIVTAFARAAKPAFWIRLAGMLFFMISIILIMRLTINAVQKTLNFSPGHFTVLTVLVLYFAWSRLNSLMQENKIVAWAAYFLFAGVIVFQHFILRISVFDTIAETVAASFFMIVVIPVAYKIISAYYEMLESDSVENVRMGVTLSEETVRKFKTDWGVEVPANLPLTDEQTQLVKDAIPNMEKIRVVRHITFGPFIFVGAVFTILFQHTIIHYL